jgi:hypothetical protein
VSLPKGVVFLPGLCSFGFQEEELNKDIPYINSSSMNIYHAHHINKCKAQSAVKIATTLSRTSNLPPALLGASLGETTVLVASTREQLAVPHPYPLGQQFPPRLAEQESHPEAQLPVGLAVVAAAPTGTTIVTPELIIVVEDVAGQEVVSQFRPVRQQPPA